MVAADWAFGILYSLFEETTKDQHLPGILNSLVEETAGQVSRSRYFKLLA